jgi:hypothetical protein
MRSHIELFKHNCKFLFKPPVYMCFGKKRKSYASLHNKGVG